MELMSIGDVARSLDLPIHRVKYAIERYRITPTHRFGIMRVWDKTGLERIRRAIRRIERKSVYSK